MLSRNALIIIPFVGLVWLGTLLIGRDGPTWLQVAFFIAVGLAIPCLLLYLMAGTGWRTLARAHPAERPYHGEWKTAAAGNVSRVSVRDPDFTRHRTRLASILRVGADEHALHLATFFSRIPVLKIFFPAIQLPWGAVRLARPYNATGWVASSSIQSRARMRASYDPHYTGAFVELVIGNPPTFIQLPFALLGEGAERLNVATPEPEPATR